MLLRNPKPLNYLDPQKLRLETAPDGTLRAHVEGDRCGLAVEIVRAFPLSHPEGNIVLRDGGSAELGVLEKLSDLAEPGQTLARAALEKRYFLPQITGIKSIYERFGSSIWELETDRGPIEVTTKAMHEAISELEPGRYLLRDTEDNRYEIKDLSRLDKDSRARFLGKF